MLDSEDRTPYGQGCSTEPLALNHSPTLAVRSHGWALLAPYRFEEGNLSYAIALPESGPGLLDLRWDELSSTVWWESPQPLAEVDREFLEDRLRWMFRLDESFEAFWKIAQHDADLDWVGEYRAGALLRSGSLFEDVVKTLLTVNCSWVNTVRMSRSLCERFGEPVQVSDGSEARFTFPSPLKLAETAESELRDARLGFRAKWIHTISSRIAAGELDLEAWIGRDDPDALRAEVLSLPGVGPYAASHILMILGHYDRIPADTEAASHLGLPPGTTTAAIERAAQERYAQWGANAFLAYRFTKMRHRALAAFDEQQTFTQRA